MLYPLSHRCVCLDIIAKQIAFVKRKPSDLVVGRNFALPALFDRILLFIDQQAPVVFPSDRHVLEFAPFAMIDHTELVSHIEKQAVKAPVISHQHLRIAAEGPLVVVNQFCLICSVRRSGCLDNRPASDITEKQHQKYHICSWNHQRSRKDNAYDSERS